MSLIQALPPGPLDIVGDVHGELQLLQSLMQHLGYDAHGRHPEGRHLVFVGDIVDRGPHSPGALALVQRLVFSGHAWAVVGNHEINLARNDAKDGSGWFFAERLDSDREKYGNFARAHKTTERAQLQTFAASLPLALERADLRVVHAAWQSPQIAQARTMPAGSARAQYDHWENAAEQAARASRIAQRMQAEKQVWPHSLEDGSLVPPFLQAHCDSELNKSSFNPLKVLTCGIERQASAPFFAGNKWRFVERVAWWDSYTDDTPVVVGHYWRSFDHSTRTQEGLFANVPALAWHGQKNNVFCVDYSAGARAQTRLQGRPIAQLRLAALRWPERTVTFDNGESLATTDFGPPAL